MSEGDQTKAWLGIAAVTTAVAAGVWLDLAMAGTPQAAFGVVGEGALVVLSALALFPRGRTWARRHVMVHGCAILLVLVMARWHLPLRLGFAASKARLGEIACAVAEGRAVRPPLRAGWFTLRSLGMSGDGTVHLWTHADAAGNLGFLYGYQGRGYNLWSRVPLGEGWDFVVED